MVVKQHAAPGNKDLAFSLRLSCVIVVLLLAMATPACGTQKIRLATLNWPPYIGADLKSEGYAAEVIRAAFERKGYQVEYFFMPWQRAVKTVMQGSYDGLCPAYYTAKRAKTFSMSQEFPAGPMMLAKRVDRDIRYRRIEDLKPYSIAVVRGYANTKAFDEASYLEKSFTNCDQTGYRRLLFGRVDLWVVDKFVAQVTMASHLPERAKEIEFIRKPLGVKNLHVAFSRSKANFQALTESFDQGLAEVLADGTLEQILAHHGLSLN